MRHMLKLCVFAVSLLGFGAAFAPASAQESCDHSRGKTTDNFFGYARFIATPVFVCENSALSVLGEAGYRNYRINGTWGTFCQDQHRFKIGGEYLAQKIHYNFSSGKADRWRQQWAIGAKYQYWFLDCCEDVCGCGCWDWIKGIQLVGDYSHANNHRLSDDFCDSPSSFLLGRRVAGSWSANGEFGVILAPWECGSFIVGVGYDYVHYSRHFQGTKNVQGVGGSIEWNQKFCGCFGFDLKAQFKRPYNYLEALLSWTNRTSCGDFEIGIFGAHTWGKCHLASSSAAGVELRYTFGIDDCFNIVWCDPCSDPYDCCNPCNYSELGDWVSSPAVYMPEVLAIPDQGPSGNA